MSLSSQQSALLQNVGERGLNALKDFLMAYAEMSGGEHPCLSASRTVFSEIPMKSGTGAKLDRL